MPWKVAIFHIQNAIKNISKGNYLTLATSGGKFKQSQSRFRSDSKKLHAHFPIFVQDHDNPKFSPDFQYCIDM